MKGALEGFPHAPSVDEVTPLRPAKHALWYVLLSHPGFENKLYGQNCKLYGQNCCVVAFGQLSIQLTTNGITEERACR